MLKNVKLGDIQFVEVTSFVDDEGKTQTFFKPAVCYFGGNPITKFEGKESDSIAIHSLDGNHNNIVPENKVPSHKGCHHIFHNTGKVMSEKSKKKIGLAKLGDKNPMKRPEVAAKFKGAKNPMKRPEVKAKITGKKNPFYGKNHPPETIKRIWKTRRERYGPSGRRKKEITK